MGIARFLWARTIVEDVAEVAAASPTSGPRSAASAGRDRSMSPPRWAGARRSWANRCRSRTSSPTRTVAGCSRRRRKGLARVRRAAGLSPAAQCLPRAAPGIGRPTTVGAIRPGCARPRKSGSRRLRSGVRRRRGERHRRWQAGFVDPSRSPLVPGVRRQGPRGYTAWAGFVRAGSPWGPRRRLRCRRTTRSRGLPRSRPCRRRCGRGGRRARGADVLGLLVAELALDPQPQRRAVGDVERARRSWRRRGWSAGGRRRPGRGSRSTAGACAARPAPPGCRRSRSTDVACACGFRPATSSSGPSWPPVHSPMQLQPSTQSWRVIWVRAGRARSSAERQRQRPLDQAVDHAAASRRSRSPPAPV